MVGQGGIDYDAIASAVPVGVIEVESGKVSFHMPSPMAAYRFESLFTKEPETIRWISGFEPGAVFVDIGANVGCYTIWAALHRRMQVFAFEPEAQNFATLNNNILLNELGDQVIAFPLAVSDRTQCDVLNLGAVGIGKSMNSFGAAVDGDLNPRPPIYRQGSMAVSLDELVAAGAVPMPNYIKVDVDGFEHKVIDGAQQVFARAEVTSALIEMNNAIPEHRQIPERMADLGFDAPPELSDRLKQKDGGNCIFRRTAT